MNTLNTDAHFDGETYSPSRDKHRLKGQLKAVYEAMQDGKWHSLQGLALSIGAPEASISARLRDLRKDKFGGFTVKRRNLGGGRWNYCMEESK